MPDRDDRRQDHEDPRAAGRADADCAYGELSRLAIGSWMMVTRSHLDRLSSRSWGEGAQ